MSSCKLCKSSGVKKIFESGDIHGRHLQKTEKRFNIFRCEECGLVFIADIKLDASYYAEYYQPRYYENGRNGSHGDLILSQIEKFSFSRKERLIHSFLPPLQRGANLKILDIGCGEGRFLDYLSADGYEKYGLEANEEGIKACQKKKMKIFSGSLAAANFADGFFDVVTLWHVIEHVDDPRGMLADIKKILKKDGVFALSTPNTDSLGFRWGKNIWFHLDAPRHLALFNRINIAALLKKSGFRIAREENCFYDYPLDLFWSIRRSLRCLFAYPLYPFFKIASAETILLICKKEEA